MNKILKVIACISVATCFCVGCGSNADSSKKVESSKETSSVTEGTKDENEGLPIVNDSVVREFKLDTPENAIREFYANVSTLNEKEYNSFYQKPDGYKTIMYSWKCYGIEKIDVTKVETEYDETVPNEPIAVATVQYKQKLKGADEPLETFTFVVLRKLENKWVIAGQDTLTQGQDAWFSKMTTDKSSTDEYKKIREGFSKFQEKNSELMKKGQEELDKYLKSLE